MNLRSTLRPALLGSLLALTAVACGGADNTAHAQGNLALRAEPGSGGHRWDPVRMVARFDANGDGRTTLDELPPRVRERVAPADADRDGAITAQELTAVEARAIGLVDYVAEPGAAMATAVAWCTDIEAAAPSAIEETKRLLRDAAAASYTRIRPLERDAFIRTWSSAAHEEAMEAYFSRRPPKW